MVRKLPQKFIAEAQTAEVGMLDVDWEGGLEAEFEEEAAEARQSCSADCGLTLIEVPSMMTVLCPEREFASEAEAQEREQICSRAQEIAASGIRAYITDASKTD